MSSPSTSTSTSPRIEKVAGLVDGVRRGDPRFVARTLRLIEDGDAEALRVVQTLFTDTGSARTIGITGSPGAGKSTIVSGLLDRYRELGRSVAVLAVDPSSPFTGGALLGDRIRMGSHAGDDGVFIRSMATRGELGGLSAATMAGIRVLDAAGFDVVIVETVGVGQSEVAIADAVDCTVMVVVPGSGDIIQTLKAGVMEIGDVFVVNKSDLPGADRARRDIQAMIGLGDHGQRRPDLLTTRADRSKGIGELVAAIDGFLEEAQLDGRLESRRLERLQAETLALIGRQARQRLLRHIDQELADELIDALRERRMDPAQAAAVVLDRYLVAMP